MIHSFRNCSSFAERPKALRLEGFSGRLLRIFGRLVLPNEAKSSDRWQAFELLTGIELKICWGKFATTEERPEKKSPRANLPQGSQAGTSRMHARGETKSTRVLNLKDATSIREALRM